MSIQPLLEWLEVSSPSQKLVVLLVSLGIVSLLVYGLALGPRLDRVNNLQQEVQALEQVLKTQTAYGHQRATLDAEVTGLRQRYRVMSETLGMPVAGAEVLSGVSNAANQAGVSLMLWKPEPAVPAPDYNLYETESRLEIEGNFYGLARFLGKLARLPKALVVKAFSISASDRGQAPNTIRASLDLFGYESRGLLGLEE